MAISFQRKIFGHNLVITKYGQLLTGCIFLFKLIVSPEISFIFILKQYIKRKGEKNNENI